MYLTTIIHAVLSSLVRMGARFMLRLDWYIATTEGNVIRPDLMKRYEMFIRIDAEIRMLSLRELVEKMRFYRFTFKELGISPLEFWETMKRYAAEIRREIEDAFTGNYFGKQLANRCLQTLGYVLGFIREQLTGPMATLG